MVKDHPNHFTPGWTAPKGDDALCFLTLQISFLSCWLGFNYLLHCLQHILLQIGHVKLKGKPEDVGSFINNVLGKMGLGTHSDIMV